jgi:ubiquinol-cytochrome c reductase cytochrome b subunit
LAITFYVLLWIEGGNDIIANRFNLNVFFVTWFFRIGVIVLPLFAFAVTRRICLGLQRRDADKLLHGYETGVVKRLPSGEYYEQHAPVSEDARAVLVSRAVSPPLPMPAKTDANGVATPFYRLKRMRARVSAFYSREEVPMPTAEEIEAANHHEAELTAGRNTEIDSARAEILAPKP